MVVACMELTVWCREGQATVTFIDCDKDFTRDSTLDPHYSTGN